MIVPRARRVEKGLPIEARAPISMRRLAMKSGGLSSFSPDLS